MKLQEDKTRFINNLPWDSEAEKSKVLDFFKTHANLESKIQNWQSKDKERLVNEIRDLISKAEKASLEKEKSKEGYRGNIDWESHDCKYLDEDENWVYITPLSHEGAIFCDSAECGGAGAKWCIGYERSRIYWDRYQGKKALFLMKFNKHPKNKQEDLKFMIEGYPGRSIVNIWNQQDCKKRYTLSENEKNYLETIQRIPEDTKKEAIARCFDNPKPGVYIAKNEEAFKYIKDIKEDLKVFKVKDEVIFKNVKDASHMFSCCTSLTSIDTSGFKNVTDAEGMFFNCTSLTSIDTSAFKNVEDAFNMFWGCKSLTSINTSAFVNVKNAGFMFASCPLTSIDTSAFVNVENTSGMFDGCESLTSVDTSAFKNVENAYSMFLDCTSLTSIDTSAFRNVKDAREMFKYCKSLTSIDTSVFKNVERADGMFEGCTSLTSIDTSAFVNVKGVREMFKDCKSLTFIDTSAFVNVKNAQEMFKGCKSLTSIDTSAFVNVENAYQMFSRCTSLTSVDTSALVNVWNVSGMFYGCKSLKTYIPGSNNLVNAELEKIRAKPAKKLGESFRRRIVEEILEE